MGASHMPCVHRVGILWKPTWNWGPQPCYYDGGSPHTSCSSCRNFMENDLKSSSATVLFSWEPIDLLVDYSNLSRNSDLLYKLSRVGRVDHSSRNYFIWCNRRTLAINPQVLFQALQPKYSTRGLGTCNGAEIATDPFWPAVDFFPLSGQTRLKNGRFGDLNRQWFVQPMQVFFTHYSHWFAHYY